MQIPSFYSMDAYTVIDVSTDITWINNFSLQMYRKRYQLILESSSKQTGFARSGKGLQADPEIYFEVQPTL